LLFLKNRLKNAPRVFISSTSHPFYILISILLFIKVCNNLFPFFLNCVILKAVINRIEWEVERISRTYETRSPRETEEVGAAFAKELSSGAVVALYGDLGMGKTAFVRGMARGLGLDAQVSSPTFALVNEYGGDPPLVHFDMYRVSGWEDLYSTGFFDYIDAGCILAVEWSERIEGALPPDAIKVRISATGEASRRIEIEGGENG